MNHEDKIHKMFEVFFELKNHANSSQLEALIKDKIFFMDSIIFCGVGKNFWLAEKLAATYKSLGIKSSSLCPVHAMHGDMGAIHKDVIICLSKSGTTKELTTFVEYIWWRKQHDFAFDPALVGIFLNSEFVSHPERHLYKLIITPNSKEIFEFDERNIVPTLSINIIQMYLDYIGVKVYENNSELVKKFELNHPAGNIGKITGMDRIGL